MDRNGTFVFYGTILRLLALNCRVLTNNYKSRILLVSRQTQIEALNHQLRAKPMYGLERQILSQDRGFEWRPSRGLGVESRSSLCTTVNISLAD